MANELAVWALNEYATTVNGLTYEECVAKGMKEDVARTLSAALGRGAEGRVTYFENQSLELDFSQFFYHDGQGLKALQARAKWIAESSPELLGVDSDSYPLIQELRDMIPVAPDMAEKGLLRAIGNQNTKGAKGWDAQLIAIKSLELFMDRALPHLRRLIETEDGKRLYYAVHALKNIKTPAAQALLRELKIN